MNTQSKVKKIKGNKQKLKLFRSNDPLKSVLMWGINYSMSQLAHVTRKAVLMDEDFKGYIKAAIENHQFNKEYIPSHYKFKEYAPMVFLDLRKRFHVDDREYLESLTSCPPLRLKKSQKAMKNSLMLSQNRRYAVRIVSADDMGTLQGFLAAYHEHIVNQHAITLLSHILALYRVTVNDQHTHLVVMKNITYPPGHLSRLYLLDGSLTDKRDSGDSASYYQQLQQLQNEGKWFTFNDSQLVLDEVKIVLSDEDREHLINTLYEDMTFLEKCKIMRYKVLFGMRDIEAVRYKERTGVSVGGGGTTGQASTMYNRLNFPASSPEEGDSHLGGHGCALPVCSEEEEFNNGAGCSHGEYINNSSDNDDIENEASISLANIAGSRIGEFGLRDKLDRSVIYYVGIVDFYRRKSGVITPGGASSSGGGGSNLSGATSGRKTSVVDIGIGRKESISDDSSHSKLLSNRFTQMFRGLTS